MTGPRKRWIVVVLALGACVAFIIGGVVCMHLRSYSRQRMQDEALSETMRQSAPIVAAIQRFIMDHGEPPDTLDDLNPNYLRQLPYAGPFAENGWHYYSTDVDENAGGWSLLVSVREEYSPNVFGSGDRFVFHPSGNYPREGYGGMLLSTPSAGRKWGYYVE